MSKTPLKKDITKLLLILIFIFSNKIASASILQADSGLLKTDTAFVPKEIQDPRCIGIHKEPAHATLMPYANLTEALKANRRASSFAINLNGLWKFNWVDWPQKRPENFYKPSYDVSSWKEIKVPSSWQVEGYGTPVYSNFTFIFKKDFPRVMSTPPTSYTTYKERDPVGSYRRDFTVPENWNGRRIFITFDGVDAGFFIWVNGQKVGYSVNSRNAAEFDLTNYVKPGKNILAVEVYRLTTGSYLEDQDMWKLSGIFRNVTLWSSPQEHIRDYFIKTPFDPQFQNADLQVSTKVKNYGTVAVKGRILAINLYNGATRVPGVFVKKAIPALKPGEEVEIDASIPVKSPEKWTAETPKLYTTVLTINDGARTVETISSRTGFRQIEIKGRIFTVNGVPIKLKGVNRHENWPDDGHAITEAQMVRDIELIKQANCNHVRTCHYSDDPRWYELCDEYGIYLVAEANLECHGAWDDFNEDPRIKAALIDRNVANVQNFKNHPSVIIWSLGNECGSGGSNFRDMLKVVKSLDPTRPTHYQGFGIGKNNPADIESEMYTDLDNLVKHATDTSIKKPFYLCEYAHTMFNSMGSVDIYNELFDKYPTLLGGAIWEWQDQGIYNNRDPERPLTAFGGGFGDHPNDHYFIHKGVVFSDRSPKPAYPELKRAYQWISIQAKDLKNGIVTIKDKYQFINLNGFTAKWEVSEDGTTISSGNLPLGEIKPGESRDVKIPYHINPKPGAEYFLRVSFDLANDQLWAKKGFEVAAQQLELPIAIPAIKEQVNNSALTFSETGDLIKVNCPGFDIEFDKKKGTFSKLETGGNNLLRDNGGPMLNLWRAPHQKDDMWAGEDWEKYGLNAISWATDDVKTTQLTTGEVQIAVSLTGTGKKGFVVHHQVVYTINSNGLIDAVNKVSFSKPDMVLARLGVRMLLSKTLDKFDYLGRGPMENYADRKQGSDVGHYFSSVAEQLTPYEKPMECGNHEDVRWARLNSDRGEGLTVKQDTALMQVSALPYSDEEMDPVEYRTDLPKSKGTVLCISHKTLGVGSNGCGPKTLEQYRVYSNEATFNYQIQLFGKIN